MTRSASSLRRCARCAGCEEGPARVRAARPTATASVIGTNGHGTPRETSSPTHSAVRWLATKGQGPPRCESSLGSERARAQRSDRLSPAPRSGGEPCKLGCVRRVAGDPQFSLRDVDSSRCPELDRLDPGALVGRRCRRHILPQPHHRRRTCRHPVCGQRDLRPVIGRDLSVDAELETTISAPLQAAHATERSAELRTDGGTFERDMGFSSG